MALRILLLKVALASGLGRNFKPIMSERSNRCIGIKALPDPIRVSLAELSVRRLGWRVKVMCVSVV